MNKEDSKIIKKLISKRVNRKIKDLQPKNTLKVDEKVQLLRDMIVRQDEQHKGLLETLIETRNVCNYVMTGLIAYCGFLFNSTSFLQQFYQKLFIYSLFLVVLIFWLIINWSKPMPMGLDPVGTAQYFFNSNDINVIDLHKNILNKGGEEYILLQDRFKSINYQKKYFLSLALLFFVISVIFILLGNRSIEFQLKLN